MNLRKEIQVALNSCQPNTNRVDKIEAISQMYAKYYHSQQLIQPVVVGQGEQDCDVCRPITEGFYLGGTCQKCLKPFREFKQS
jgi:hypothetical protein